VAEETFKEVIMNLRILTHDGLDLITNVETFNAAEVNEKLNNNDVHTIVLGNMIFSRINIKAIIPEINETL
jgi:hypothetical protein